MTSRFDLITNAQGIVAVRNQQATIILDPVEYAFLGNSTVTIKIRQDSVGGPVLLESPPISIIDNAEFLSVTANTYSVAEGQDVGFTILTRNAPDGATIAYIAESLSGNITANDLSIGNVSALAGGFAQIIDNIATFTVFANVDNTLGDVGEAFRMSIRAGNISGLILGYSDNVVIKDTTEFYSISSNKSTVDFNTNVTFTIQTFDVADGANLFYFTQGDVINFDSSNAQSNTGYVVTSSNVATVTLRPIAPTNSILPFNLLIRDANTNILLASSSGVNSIGEDTKFTSITGGIEIISGNYKYHRFNSSNTFVVNRVGETYPEIDIVVIGAGQPGGSGIFGTGGGGGQVVSTTYNLPVSTRFTTGIVTTASSSPTGVSPSSQLAFGGGGNSFTAASGNRNTSGSGFGAGAGLSTSSTSFAGTGGGGGAGGAGQPGQNLTPFYGYSRYQSGAGGTGVAIPWLPTSISGSGSPVFATSNFTDYGAGGGGGTAPYPFTSGSDHFVYDGATFTSQQRTHIYTPSPTQASLSQQYTYYTTSPAPSARPFPFGGGARAWGQGGGGGCFGRQTSALGPSRSAYTFPITNSEGLAAGGMPGAVFMRYRIAED